MQRRRLSTVLASLGLAACARTDEPSIEPARAPESLAGSGSEPSGLGPQPKPAERRATAEPEPHFHGVPLEFCQATLQRRDDSLVRTASFLEAWNELAPPFHNRLASNIPAAESDARALVCGSDQCRVDAARLAEVQADYMVGVGVLIPIPETRELLVVPSVADPHGATPCANESTAEIERHGRFIHVRATTTERHYNYGHGHGYGHGYGGYGGYEPIPMSCETYARRWRDLVIDADGGELELILDQSQTDSSLPPPVALEFDAELPGIRLRGCETTLALVWTQ